MVINRSKGFSLVELLVVVAIMILLMALATPNIVSVLAGMRLGQAMQTVVDEINFCREVASTNNADVELCFLSTQPRSGGGNAFCGVASRQVKHDGTTVWLRNPKWLPAGIVLASGDKDYSNILSIFDTNTNATYVPLRIRPNGTLCTLGKEFTSHKDFTLGGTVYAKPDSHTGNVLSSVTDPCWYITVLPQRHLNTRLPRKTAASSALTPKPPAHPCSAHNFLPVL